MAALRAVRAAVVYLLLAAGLALTAPLLLVLARTWRGRGFAWVCCAPFAALLAVPHFPMVGNCFSVVLVALVLVAARTRARVGRFHSSLPAFAPDDRWASAGLLPETDLIRLGAAVVTRVDPWMSRAEARTIRRVLGPLLADLDRDPHWAGRPASGLVVAVLALAWGRHTGRHRFVYWPELRSPGERVGLLVLLHGHGWNAAVWPFVWRAFADEHRFAVFAPSFGWGNWEHPDGVGVVEHCLDGASFELFDPTRVYLAGISQGGCGVGRAGAALADRLAGLVFISPTMEPDVLGSAEFVEGWKGRPVLVIQGGRDHNVQPATVDAAVEQLRANGAVVTYHRDPEADHFLFFARLGDMHRRIGGWMAAS